MNPEDQIYKIRHSLAHLLAIAVLEYDPEAKLAIGPVIENGFYYDFEFSKESPSQKDLKNFQKTIKKLASQNLNFTKEEISEKEAREIFKDQPYKIELIDGILKEGSPITIYKTKDFIDLCEGPHVSSTKEINPDAMEITHIAGAYWRGSEKNKMLTRIYGLAFENKEELEGYKKMREEAEKRDHRKIGKEQELFFIDEMVGKGLVMWLPNGNILRNEIEKFAVEMEDKGNYVRVTTPHIAKEELYLTSGHLPYYKEDMYPPMEMDDGTYYLRAMNCPHHHRIYVHKPHSYRDLPIRMAEYGTVYRNERSGTLAGLLRVRGLSMNDAHIYCTKDQIKEEFKAVMGMVQKYFETFGLTDYWFRLSKWNPDRPDKYINEPENWEYTQNIMREALEEMGVKFTEADDEAAFYGPKVDVQFTSVIGREETMSTIQLDFLAKERFNLEYKDKDGNDNKDVFVIHRAPLSTHERFIAFLIEHYGGKFPLWLSPVQVSILPVGKDHKEYAYKVFEELKNAGIRVSINDADETLGKRIRQAKLSHVPYFLVIGDNEAKSKTVNLESRDKETLGQKTIEDLTTLLKEEVYSRK